MSDVFHCEAVNNILKRRTGNQKMVAKVMASGSETAFFQEVAIMALFIGHDNFVIMK